MSLKNDFARAEALVWRQAHSTPDAPALRDRTSTLSYAALQQSSRHIASQLRTHVPAVETRAPALIGIATSRCAGMLVTVLGVLEAHAAYVPFDEKWPAVRAEQIVADTRAAAVVADATTLEAVLHFTRQSACTAVLCIDERFELRVVRAASVVPSLDVDLHALLSAVPNSDLCYVLYTSGTTGLPKGVAVAHTGVVNQISAVGSSVVSADDVRVTLFTTSLCFDASLDEIFLPLSLGGCIVVADNLLVLADADAAQRFSDVTFLNGTPSAMQMVVELHALPRSVRAIELGGEALSAALVRQLYDAGVARVANVYGPTECTNECIVSILPRHPPDRIPIGRPIAGVEAYVVGADGQRVTHDATGELLIGGAGVAFGYLRRPEQTAERFVVNPFGSGRVYRTGDVVRVLADGQLEFVGRVDNQVKVRGFRIELEEVEAALAACAHVAAACVSVQDGQLVAHVMPSGRDLSLLDAAALRSAMAARVPAYMVPAAFQFIEELPLAVTGKVDRKALPPVRLGTAVVATATAGAAEPPSSDVERQILAAWRDVLCAPHIGVLDNFYDIGGNSLAAVRIVARCRAAGLERVSIKLLRDHNTVRALSDAIATAVANNSVDSSDASADVMLPADASARLAKFDVGERRDELCDVYTLTPLQAGMLFFTLKEPTAGVYADQWLCDLVGELDVDALQQSWQRVVHKHDSLRASFLWHELEEPLQLVWRNVALAWSVVDLVGVDESARDTTIESFLRRDRARGFQLDSAPLMRFALFCVEPRRHVFVWTSHHILMDGWSLPLILHDVFGGAGERVAPKFAPFVRHLLAQRSRHASAREFWRAQLASLPERRELPFALPRIVPPDEPFPQVSVTFDAELGARVFACARSLRVTPSTVLQGAWLLLLSCLTDSSDVVTGMTVAGRPPELTDVETTVGNFLNALPLIARIEPSESVADFFGKLQRSLVALAEFDDLPLVDIQRLAPSDGGSLFDSLVVFEDVCTADYGRAFGADVTAVRWFETTNFLLTFAFAIGEHGGVLNVTFDATRLTRARCEWFVGRYVALLESCVRDTQRPASRLEVVGERADLRGWNDTQCVVPDLCLHQLLERQCTATPAALAVVDDSVRWSYSELLAAVNRVAAAAGADRLIGILMSRTAALVAAVYGVLSAGAAYVPLDAGWPAERIAFVAGDAELSTVLTDSATWQRSGGALLEAAHAIGVRVTPLFVDELLSRADSGAPAAPAPSRICSPTSLAYVLYTSGTTGKPKGVCVEHRSVVNEVWHMGTRILTPPDLHCALFSTSVCFDASVDELFVPLAFGGRIVVVPSVLALCDATAAARLRANGDDVTLLNGTPSAIQMLVDTGQVPRSVRVVILGGEALPRRTADGLFATLGHDVRIFNVYGPTEATDLCLVERVLPGDTGAPLLGFAISNMCTHVVSTRSLMPLPVGVPGELVVQGVGVARGYWRRDELTRERFLEPSASPHWRASDGRAYRTGDLVRRHEDGRLEYLGRIDRQVKLRGYRIELGEVEAHLCEYTDASGEACVERAAAVVARVNGTACLVAYYVGRATRAALLAHCEASMPKYMVPTVLMRIDAMPLNRNDKVDYKLLPSPIDDAPVASVARALNPREQLIADIFVDVLQVSRAHVDANSDFFALGGDSLSAMRTVARINTALKAPLSLASLFANPTIVALAALSVAPPQQLSVPIRRVALDSHAGVVCSYGQERLFFLNRMYPTDSEYHMPSTYVLRGALDVVRLQAALNIVVDRHEVLRTTYRIVNDTVRQFVHNIAPVHLQVEDVRATLTLTDVVGAEATRNASIPFDLANGPILRARLLLVEHNVHVLLLNIHHIAGDGASFDILDRDLKRAYEQQALAPVAFQYADYAMWQREALAPVLSEQLAYWRAALGDDLSPIELPYDGRHPSTASFGASSVTVRVPSALANAVRGVARAHGATMFMTLLAAWQAVLHVYSRQDNVSVGAPIAGRGRSEFDETVGVFVNTLVLRARFGGAALEQQSFGALLEQVKRAVLGAFDNQDVPFEQLVKELQPERDERRNPLFQVFFDVSNAETATVNAGGDGVGTGTALGTARWGEVAVEMHEPPTHSTQFELALSLAGERDGSLVGELEYASELFEAATAQRIAAHWLELLRCVAESEGGAAVPLRDVCLMSASEHAQEREQWNATVDGAWPRDETLDSLLARQVARTPTACAVRDGAALVTYAELAARRATVARAIGGAGGRGDERLVGVLMARGANLVAALFGVLHAGAAYVAFDTAWPAERMAYVARDARLSALLTDGETWAQLGGALRDAVIAGGIAGTDDGERQWTLPEPVLVDELLARGDAAAAAVSVSTPPQPASLAYVLYTSGTTGKPKGVAVEHRSVVNEVWHMGAHVLAEGDVARALFATSVCFDASVDELFVPLAFGGSVVVVRNLLALCDEEDAQARAAVACGVTLLNGTPSGVQMLLDTRRVPRTARVVLLGGEALSRRTADALHAELGGAARVINVYGPTEATDLCLVERVLAGDAGAPLLGRPIGNMCAHVMAARSLTPLPVGVPGELVVQGVGVARGYWRRDELTRERFLEPTASANWRASDGRAYRTGDLVRRHADGRLEYMGRIDRQVKLRGYRIELDEVEAQLCAFVSDDGARRVERAAAVVTRLTGASDDVLVAYYVGSAEEAELLARCARTMPKYMVPAVLMRIDAIPLTSTDKVNYKALPAPSVSRVDADAGEIEGKPYDELSETERTIADIWADVLGSAASAIRSASNFFALGGDSLSAMRAMARLSEQVTCELPLSALFQNAVVCELAAFVEAKRGASGAGANGAVARVAIERVLRAAGAEYAVSFAQERLWFLDQLFPGGSEYNMPARYELRGALDAEALRGALGALVARHEALRMRFVNKGGRGVSSVLCAPDDANAVEWREIRVADEAAADAACDAEASRSFSLSVGPPIRALLVRRQGDAQHASFVLTAHHIVGDGASFRVIEAELKALYEAAVRGALDGALRPLKYDYVDYAHWQREALAPVLSEQLAYWRAALGDDLSPIELPYDGRHPSTASFGASSVTVRVPSALANAVRGVARAHGATMFMTLLAAWQAVLHVYSRQDNVSVGAPIAGRGRSEFDETVGVFVNTLVLRARFGGAALEQQSFGALLEQVKRAVLGAFDNQDVPFEQLVKELQPERDERRNPLFQVFFDVSNAETATVNAGGDGVGTGTALGTARWGEVAVEMHEPPTHSTQFELALSLAGERDGSLVGELEYASELFEAATAQRIAAHWLELLRCVAESEGGAAVPLRDVCLMSASEHAQEREQWNATVDGAWPRDETLDSLLARQVARTPTACAVRDGAALVTYAELAARRATVARAIGGAGGRGDERLVGVLMARGANLVAALFGVLHAGAAYVAFDTAWPAERMAYVARDARLSALLTDGETWAQLGGALRDAVIAGGIAGTDDGERQWTLPEPVLVDELLARGDAAAAAVSVSTPPQPASLAYVLYTSGTTGKPKGVAVEHRSVVNEVWHMGAHVLAEGDVARALFATSVCFDASVDELFVPLAFGGSVVVVRNLLALCDEEDAQARAAVACGVTLLNGTPSGVQMLLDTRRVPRTARVVLLGGEALSRRTADALHAELGGAARVINVYGPTEATDLCLVERVLAGDAGAPLLGRPIGNMCAHVMAARSLTPLPVGVPGELVVQGVGVARGYWRRDELTRERFLEPTASANWRASDGRAYRTGDLARRHADGRLEYMGRIDRQVKLRGYRIELDEVEAQLCAFVSDDGARRVERAAAVVTRLTGASDDVLVAYYVGSAEEAELLARCARTMPKYMVPAVLMRIDAIPLTSTDKVNYKALPAPSVSRVDADAGEIEGKPYDELSETERTIADIWADVLGSAASAIRSASNFFALGGDSLSAMRAMARLSEQVTCELPLSALFQNAVVCELAAFVEAKRGASGAGANGAVARVAIERVLRAAGAEYAVSFAQERLWFLDQLFPGGSEYNMPARYELRGALDAEALRGALGALVARHEALRMRFVNKGGRGVSSVLCAPDDANAVEWREIRVADEAAADAACDAEASRSFSLSVGPPIRALLVRRQGDAQHASFVLTAHHIVGDGASFRVIEAELKALYEAAVRGALDGALRPLKYDYVDYAHWQREALAPVLSEQLAYWRAALGDDLSPIELPYDGRHPSTASFGASSVTVRVPSALANAVRGVARAHGATMFMTLLAAWQAVLHVYSRQDNVSVGAPIAGRGRSEFDETVGVFVNTLVLRARFGGAALEQQSFGALLEQVKRAVLGAFDNQDVPFEQLVKELQPERDERRNPLFQVFFDVSNAETATVNAGGDGVGTGTALGTARWGEVAVEMHEPPTHSTQFELALSLAGERDGSLVGELEYASELFEAATAQRIAAHWLELLRCVAESEGGAAVPLRDVCLMSASEHAQEREQWNATVDGAWPRDETLDSLLARQVARTPTACAVRDGAALVTYAELAARRATVARAIGGAGGRGDERLVGVLMARGANLVAALFGVLHAGAAYVAFDTAWPAERMAYVARDARLSALLTDGETWAQLGGALRDAVIAGGIAGTDDGERQWTLPEPVLVDELLARGDAAAAAVSVSTPPQPASLAYVLYTSGTTGKPKGVAVEHRSVVNEVWHMGAHVLAEGDVARALFATSVCFDASVDELFVPLAFGGSVVVVRNLLALCDEEDAQARAAVACGVTLLNGTPSGVQMLLDTRRVPRTARVVLLGGEALSRRTADALHAELGGAARVINVYGPTEATDLCLVERVLAGDAGAPLLGRPIGNMCAHVMAARSLTPLPVGVPGELVVQGVGVARGYWRRDELTRERFLEPTASANWRASDGRAYRTGDLVRRHADGRLEYMGRIDRQVKLRGYRIELDEVEAQLCAFVSDDGARRVERAAAVVTRLTGASDDVLVAYYVGSAEEAELLARCARTMPKYMVPAVLMRIDAIPLTSTDKVNYKALPAPSASGVAAVHEVHSIPSTFVERAVADAFSRTLVLQVSDVFLETSFFEAGGSSLAAVSLVDAIGRVGLRCTVGDVFACPRVGELSAAVAANMSGATHRSVVRIAEGGRKPDTSQIFLVHPAGGSVFCFFEFGTELARLCDIDVYGVQFTGAEFGSLTAMAEQYIGDVLRAADRSRPLLLGGYSFGATVACEMARIASARGVQVSALVLLDSAPAAAMLADRWDDADDLKRQSCIEFFEYFGGGEAEGERALAECVAAQVVDADAQVARIAASLASDALRSKLQQIVATYSACATLMMQFEAPLYDIADVVLVLAQEDADEVLARDAQRHFARPLRLVTCRGTHLTMLDDVELAKELAQTVALTALNKLKE